MKYGLLSIVSIKDLITNNTSQDYILKILSLYFTIKSYFFLLDDRSNI